MRRLALFSLFALTAGLTCGLVSPVLAADSRPTLTVVNWSWFVEVDEDLDESLPTVQRSPVLRQFEEEYGCQLVYVELDDEYSIRDFLLADPSNVDVVNLSTGFVHELSRQGVLRKLEPALIPHLAEVRPEILKIVPAEVWAYLSPYFGGQTGILYNPKAVGGKLETWAEFWNPEAPFLVGAFSGSETVLGTFLMMEGSHISTNDTEALKRAGRQFMQQVDLGRIGYLGDDLESMANMVAAGELGAAFMYAGDALGFIDESEDGTLAFAEPADGEEFTLDCWAVSAATGNSALAHSFIDFMLRADIQARQSLALYTQVVTTPAHNLLEEQEPDNEYLTYLTGKDQQENRTQLIHRQDSAAIDAMWDRIIGSAAK